MPGKHASNWKFKTLEERARISARKSNQANNYFPRRFVFFGPRVVPLETFLLAQARTHQRFDKARKHWTLTADDMRRGIERRNRSLEKAGVYINDLKGRLSTMFIDGIAVAEVRRVDIQRKR
jgi:hypothetical protein